MSSLFNSATSGSPGLVRFGCVALPAGKYGVIKPEADGSYRMIVGALEVYNSMGQRYVGNDEVKALFLENSSLQRRVKRGCLKGELGHPKREPGWTNDEYGARLMEIYEQSVCCLHKEINLIYGQYTDDDGNPIIAIESLIAPSGPYGPQLEKSFKTPGENVCFSIRAFSFDTFGRGGQYVKTLKQIVTWDQVTEPGLAPATAFNSKSLESYSLESFTEGVVTPAGLKAAIESRHMGGVSLEAGLMSFDDLANAVGWSYSHQDIPDILRW